MQTLERYETRGGKWAFTIERDTEYGTFTLREYKHGRECGASWGIPNVAEARRKVEETIANGRMDGINYRRVSGAFFV